MAQVVVSTLSAAFDRASNMLDQFIEVCPDAIWNKKFGGWPVWQQVYHALSVMDFFITPVGATPIQSLFDPKIAHLDTGADCSAEKEQIKAVAVNVRKAAQKYIATLSDEKLAESNETLSSKMNVPMNHAMTLALMGSHLMYHLGSCDAALREHGLKGVF